MSHFFKTTAFLAIAAAFALGACASPAQQEQPAVGIANPASENYVKQGGTLRIEKRGDGGEYGVCDFGENRLCEEWALMNGECPAGGLKMTGYLTPAAQYCAMTGGEYEITGNSGAEDEQGICKFKNGNSCDAWEYFNGKCDK